MKSVVFTLEAMRDAGSEQFLVPATVAARRWDASRMCDGAQWRDLSAAKWNPESGWADHLNRYL
jgi:hypothetical protein